MSETIEAIDTTIQQQVDRQLLEQGVFSPLELLLGSGRLMYSDYERWRRGEVQYLDELLLGSPKRVRKQLQSAIAYAVRIGLLEETEEWLVWGEGQPGTLQFSQDVDLHRLLSLRLAPQRDVPQLDMFFDNPVVSAVNAVIEALQSGSIEKSAQGLDHLYQLAPNHADLGVFDQLLEGLQRRDQPAADFPEELAFLQQLSAGAKRLLSTQSRDYLVPLWRRLAAALAGRPFDGQAPELHASYALARAESWQQVSSAVRAEPHWWLQPILCLRLAESGYRRRDRDEALEAWCQLCWLHEAQAEQALESGEWQDREILELWNRFLDVEDDLELDQPLATALFPSWLLLSEPGLAQRLPVSLPAIDNHGAKVYQITHRLALVRSQDDQAMEIDLRAELQQLQPELVSYWQRRAAFSQ